MGQCQAQFNVLVLGLENSGKTTLLQAIDAINSNERVPKAPEEPPTIGINQTGCLLDNGIGLLFTEVSANQQARRLWPEFFPGRQALVWVVDVSDENLQESLSILKKEVLSRTEEPMLPQDTIIIIYGNKFDLWLQKSRRVTPEIYEEFLKEEVSKLELKGYTIKYHWGSSLNVNAVKGFITHLSQDIANEKDPLLVRVLRKVFN
jgi:GTPase SAR1 family protein